jgi:hypothetical protein
MQFEFRYNPGEPDLRSFSEFYNSMPSPAIEQYPYWERKTGPGIRYCFFSAVENEERVCFAVVKEETKYIFKTASIEFGPLFADPDALIECLAAIHEYYKKQGMILCTVQLGIATGTEADYIEYKLNRKFPVTYVFDRNNWSSIRIDLNCSEEEIFKNFSKGHKSDIKKAIKSGITVVEQFTEQELETFAGIFIKMHEFRALSVNKDDASAMLGNLVQFLPAHKKGKILLVKDTEGNILGGIVILFQGNMVRYYKGAADPELRKIPVLHLAIWEAIRLAKQEGFKVFDFWGYNHYVNEDDQVYKINKFKKGFGGEFSFYPKKMYWIYRPALYWLYRKLKK